MHKQQSFPRLEHLEPRIALSTFGVNTTLDAVAANLKNGQYATGQISLARPSWPPTPAAGTTRSSSPPAPSPSRSPAPARTKTPPATSTSTPTSRSRARAPGNTIIDGDNLDRALEIHQGTVKISALTIRHGFAPTGGGILNDGGRVSLSSVVVTQNLAVGSDGASGFTGLSGRQDGASGKNGVNGTAGLGGGIANQAGSLTISNSTISANQAKGGDGGRGGDGGSGRGISQAG